MRNSKNIDELFSAAKNEPVMTSFDETKQAFLDSISGSSTGESGGKGGFFTQKWIIMLSIIATATITTVLLLPTTSEKTEATTKKKEKQPKNVITVSLPVTDSTYETKTIPIQKETIEMPDYLVPKELRSEFIMELKPTGFYTAKKVPQKRVAPYRFPNLTEEEKLENEKRKKEMVKDFVKMNKHNYAFIPSATVKVDSQIVSIQAFVIQKHEVTNLQYKTFLFDLLIHDRKDDFLKAKPDQNKWVKVYKGDMETMKENYFSHDAYNEYPVVTISREGAEMYCIWLTKQANKYAEEKEITFFNDIRLPQREEWIYAARGTNNERTYPWEGDSVRNEKGVYLANYYPKGEGENIYADGGFHTVKVDSYEPNEFGLYCISGNAAEMINVKTESGYEPGTAGGSWASPAENLKILGPDSHEGLTEAHPEVGFRVVCTYLNRTN